MTEILKSCYIFKENSVSCKETKVIIVNGKSHVWSEDPVMYDVWTQAMSTWNNVEYQINANLNYI